MEQPEIQLKRVHEKILQLVKQHHALQRENERMKEELKKMQIRYESLSRDADKFRQQAELLKMSGNNLEEPDKKMLEKRLNQYVREIDRCIALLHD